MKEDDALATDELIELALNENDDDARWKYVQTLHRRGDEEVFAAAAALVASGEARKITLGADVLGQLGGPELPFKDKTLPLLHELAESALKTSVNEAEIDALQSVVIALGRMETNESLKAVAAFRDHPDASVREAVAYSLAVHFEDDFVIETLIRLTGDPDEDVRNWATFALAQKDADTDEIREALYRRLSEGGYDTGAEIRGEALVGLARRKDERVVEPLLRELTAETVGVLAVEAALEFADERFCEALVKLKEWWDVDERFLDEALRACCRK